MEPQALMARSSRSSIRTVEAFVLITASNPQPQATKTKTSNSSSNLLFVLPTIEAQPPQQPAPLQVLKGFCEFGLLGRGSCIGFSLSLVLCLDWKDVRGSDRFRSLGFTIKVPLGPLGVFGIMLFKGLSPTLYPSP